MSDGIRSVFGFATGPWHEWFAWYPVETYDMGWTWLRFIWRQRQQKHVYLDGPNFRWWLYRKGALPF